MNNSIEDIIYAAIIGDACGYTLDGMKKAHIQAVFKGEDGFLDPEPALKNHMDRWRKPGLYSSITQLMLLTSASVEKNIFRMDKFIDSVRNAPELPGSELSYFRDPGQAEKHFILSVRAEKKDSLTPYAKSCARILPVAIPLLLTGKESSILNDTLRLVSLFTTDTSTAADTFFFLRILSDLCNSEGKGTYEEHVIDSIRAAMYVLTDNQHRIFENGYNPDYMVREGEILYDLMGRLFELKDPEKIEKIICETANRRQKSPVARASVNIPETLLPFALSIVRLMHPLSAIYHSASREGGSASALASVSAALSTSFSGEDIPSVFKEGLINKKRMATIIDLLSSDSRRTDIAELLNESEPGLTAKEMEEYKSRNRKEQKKPVQPKNRKDRESELTKHVVESWTKIDKAKWRKERGKGDS